MSKAKEKFSGGRFPCPVCKIEWNLKFKKPKYFFPTFMKVTCAKCDSFVELKISRTQKDKVKVQHRVAYKKDIEVRSVP